MIKENNHNQNNIYLNKKNLTQMNNKSNLYFNIMNNKNNNFSPFLKNKVENKNNEFNRNSNISINYSKHSINNYQDSSCNIYNFSNIYNLKCFQIQLYLLKLFHRNNLIQYSLYCFAFYFL